MGLHQVNEANKVRTPGYLLFDDADDNVDADAADDDDKAPPGRGNQLLPLHEDVGHWVRGWEITKGLQGPTFQSLEIENSFLRSFFGLSGPLNF